jgi:diguanylate cyclase (GGDEF)-like protein
MTAIVIGLGAAIAALLLVLVLLLVGMRRLRREGDERVAAAVGDLSARMESMVAELHGSLERANEEGRRNRFLSELAGSLDLEDVLGRVLDAAVDAASADAAMLTFEERAGAPVATTLGLSADEAEWQAVTAAPGGREVRSISIGYRYTDEELARSPDAIHSGVAVPVAAESGRIGMLTVFSRAASEPFSESSVLELEELARRAGPSVDNARRFREARQLADLDALTGLHNRRYFHETLAREVARAHRYDRRLALIVFDVDDFKAVNDGVGHLSGDAVLAEMAERVRTVVRSADIPCRIGGDEFAVVMPESGILQAEQLFGRLQAAIGGRPVGQAGRLHISAGVAELKADDDSIAFFERADEALYRAKGAGKGQSVTADGGRATA